MYPGPKSMASSAAVYSHTTPMKASWQWKGISLRPWSAKDVMRDRGWPIFRRRRAQRESSSGPKQTRHSWSSGSSSAKSAVRSFVMLLRGPWLPAGGVSACTGVRLPKTLNEPVAQNNPPPPHFLNGCLLPLWYILQRAAVPQRRSPFRMSANGRDIKQTIQ